MKIGNENCYRCNKCNIPDFMSVTYYRVSEDEGYCNDCVPKEHDPKEATRKLFDEFFGERKK